MINRRLLLQAFLGLLGLPCFAAGQRRLRQAEVVLGKAPIPSPYAGQFRKIQSGRVRFHGTLKNWPPPLESGWKRVRQMLEISKDGKWLSYEVTDEGCWLELEDCA